MAGKELVKCAVTGEVVSFSEKLKVVSDVNRLRIVCLLFSGEKCVCEIEEGLGISQPLASHHLRVLLEAGMVRVRKEGTWSYYYLDRRAIEVLNSSFDEFLGIAKLPLGYPSRSACAEEVR